MTDNLVLNEVNELSSEAKTNPENAVNNLLNITNNSDLDIDSILQEDVGIHGRLDYMVYVKQQAISNLQNGYYHYARLNSEALDSLDTMKANYVTVDESGNVAPVNTDNVLEAISDVKDELN